MYSTQQIAAILDLYKRLVPEARFDTAALAQLLVTEYAHSLLETPNHTVQNLLGAVVSLDSFLKKYHETSLYCYYSGSWVQSFIYHADDSDPCYEAISNAPMLPLGETLIDLGRRVLTQS